MDRGLGRGRGAVIVLVAAAGLLTGFVFAAGVQASGVTCDDWTGSYTGTWTANVQYASGNSASLVLKWSQTLVPGPGGASAWDLTSASGTVTYTNVADPTDSCSTSLVPNLGFADGLGNSQGPLVVEGASIVVNPVPPTW